jgi:hypothetical protein
MIPIVDRNLLDRVLRADGETISQVATAALGRDAGSVRTWQYEVLPYTQYLSSRLLLRFFGEAVDARGASAWTAILKLARPTTPDRSAASDVYAARERQAYRSGLLADLPGRLVAPRLLSLSEDNDGTTWLWIEDVKDRFAGVWPLAHYEVAARHLGQFNGSYVVDRPVPTYAWLDTEWAGGHSDALAAANCLPRLGDLLSRSEVERLFPTIGVRRARNLLKLQPQFLQALSELPETLCHHEAARANLIARQHADGGDETVAIDWETVGPGALGAEIATLVFGTLRRLEVPVVEADRFEELVLRGYLQGLADSGWHGDDNLVLLGYLLAICLRWSFMTGLLNSVVDSSAQARLVAERGRPMDELLTQYEPLTSFLLDRCDHADRLLQELNL